MCAKFINILQIILAAIIIKIKAQEKRNYYIVFTQTTSFHNSSAFVKDFNCFLRSPNNNYTQNVLDCNLIFAETIKSFDLKAKVNCYPKNSRPWTLLNVKTNGCEFLQVVQRQTIFRIFLKTLIRHLNVDKLLCPLKKDFNYTLKGFKYNPSDFPSYVPEAEYFGRIDIIVQNKLIASASLRGYVKYFPNKKGQ